LTEDIEVSSPIPPRSLFFLLLHRPLHPSPVFCGSQADWRYARR
jgi:hypothetical protein